MPHRVTDGTTATGRGGGIPLRPVRPQGDRGALVHERFLFISVLVGTDRDLGRSSSEYAAARSVVDDAQRSAEDDADVNLATPLLMINEACTVEQAEGLLRQATSRQSPSE